LGAVGIEREGHKSGFNAPLAPDPVDVEGLAGEKRLEASRRVSSARYLVRTFTATSLPQPT